MSVSLHTQIIMHVDGHFCLADFVLSYAVLIYQSVKLFEGPHLRNDNGGLDTNDTFPVFQFYFALTVLGVS